MQDNIKLLSDVLTKYAVPDPKIVSKLPRGGISLDFVGHADITRILIEVDPLWSWEPVAWNDNGRPAISVANGMATMWARLTVHGKTMLGVGSAKSDKADLDKELIGDFLRNAAMRFGISLSLWTKQEWEDLGGKPARPTSVARPASRQFEPKPDVHTGEISSGKASKVQVAFMEKEARAYGDPVDVITDILGRAVENLNALTDSEVKSVINNLNERKAKK